jgi:ribosomal protein S18 acetylase RimI-like enzyme
MNSSADPEFCSMIDRLREEIGMGGGAVPAAFEELAGPVGTEELHQALAAPGQPLWAREIAAFRLGLTGDPRAFEALVLLLNHRDPERCVSAAYALSRLGDPRTARAAAALATNELRVAYALLPVRLLADLRAPESVPALVAVLERRLAPGDPYWRVGLACVEGLGALGDPAAREVLQTALPHPRFGDAARAALGRLGEVTLRLLGAADWPVWREARLTALGDAPHAFTARLADWDDGGESRWRERLALPDAHNLVALLDGDVVGMAAGMPGDGPDARQLRSVWVSPRVRGRGVADRLVAEVASWASRSGATRLTLAVLPANTAALALYRRHGFTVVEEGRKTVMTKEL